MNLLDRMLVHRRWKALCEWNVEYHTRLHAWFRARLGSPEEKRQYRRLHAAYKPLVRLASKLGMSEAAATLPLGSSPCPPTPNWILTR